MKRETSYRYPNRQGSYNKWLTLEELEIAEIISVKWYPTIHCAESGYDTSIKCPTPEICGYYCTVEDEEKIKKLALKKGSQ